MRPGHEGGADGGDVDGAYELGGGGGGGGATAASATASVSRLADGSYAVGYCVREAGAAPTIYRP